MSGQEDVNYQDRVDIKLYGPDGKLKEHRTSEKTSIFTIIVALVLLIPYLIYKTLVHSKQ